MSSIASTGKAISNKTYITMRPYHNDIFTYTQSVVNKVDVSALTKPVGATAITCPQGSFLRETGRRLYPGVHVGVNTLMVGVFDNNTGLNGVIDPTSFAFTPQTMDRPYYIDSAGYNPNTADAPNRDDQGPPVYTHGDILADGNLMLGGNADISGALVVNGQIRSVGPNNQRITLLAPTGTNNLDISQGSFFFINNLNADITLTCNNFNIGDKLYLEITYSSSKTITFSTGFGTSNLAHTLGPTTGLWIMSFICDAYHMLEMSRTQILFTA